MDAITELKTRAELLQKRIEALEPRALRRLRMLPEYRRATDDTLSQQAHRTKRRDCLGILAAELGFSSWAAAKAAISGDPGAREFGVLLYPKRATHINLWYTTYDEADAVRAAKDAYLLPYKHQFVVADRFFIESLDLDPDDPDWRAINRDWIRPVDMSARARLYAKRIASLPRESA